MLQRRDETTIDLAEALAIVARNYGPVTDTVVLARNDAHRRILATDIFAPIQVPGADNSAVDGYGFRHADLSPGGDTVFRIVGAARAGHPFAGTIATGEAVRIFTGAILPNGVDTVAPQEYTFADADRVTVSAGPRRGENCRLAGEDIALGAQILSAGARLGPAALGMLASVGIAEIAVRQPLKVAVFSTGDELSAGQGFCAPGKIHDSNRPVLLAMLDGLGVAATDLGILPDDADTIRLRLGGAAADHDAVICSAGMSVGDEDHVKTAVRGLGTLDFWSVAIKPGRPIAIGRVAGRPFFGLPGNPVAMIVTFVMIVRPALLRLAGALVDEPRRFPVACGFSVARRAGAREYLRCTLREAEGGLIADRFRRSGSGVLSSVAGSEGLLEIAEDIGDIHAGLILPFIPFQALGL